MNGRQSKQLRRKARQEFREQVPEIASTIAQQYIPIVRAQGWRERFRVAWKVLRPW